MKRLVDRDADAFGALGAQLVGADRATLRCAIEVFDEAVVAPSAADHERVGQVAAGRVVDRAGLLQGRVAPIAAHERHLPMCVAAAQLRELLVDHCREVAAQVGERLRSGWIAARWSIDPARRLRVRPSPRRRESRQHDPKMVMRLVEQRRPVQQVVVARRHLSTQQQLARCRLRVETPQRESGRVLPLEDLPESNREAFPVQRVGPLERECSESGA